MLYRFVVVALLFLAPATAYGENLDGTYAPFYYDPAVPRALLLHGTIDQRTALSFHRALRDHPDVDVLVLNSGGGLVMNALLIAEEVHERGMSTLVGKQQNCHSACTYIFLAGRDRLALGELGVHQFRSDGGTEETTQIFLADLLDALTKFGTHPKVISRMLRTAHTDSYVFTEAEKKDLGINWSPTDEEAKTASVDHNATGNTPQQPDDVDVEKAILPFIQTVIFAHQKAGRQALSTIGQLYADNVHYFDKPQKLGQVLADKRRYFARWPIRSYSIVPYTLEIDCHRASGCSVRGIYEWQVESRRRRAKSSGKAHFLFRTTYGPPFYIIEENSRVIN